MLPTTSSPTSASRLATSGWITVELILRKVSEGADEAAVLEAYPHLTKADIQAAMA